MRKLFALAMVALLSLTIALAVLGCGKKAEDEAQPPAEQTNMAPMDSSSMMSDSMGHAGTDTTAH